MCIDFVASNSFKKQFDAILQHDRIMFDEPQRWQSKLVAQSPLITDFESIWKQLKDKYQIELAALAYRPIPNEQDVAYCFRQLIKRIE